FRRNVSAPRSIRSAAPGARFCTKTSARSRRRASTNCASGRLRSSVKDSFPRLSHTKWLDNPATVESYPRAKSPVIGRSILITRAPRSASCLVAKGTATACSRPMTRVPASGGVGMRRHHSTGQTPARTGNQLQNDSVFFAVAAIGDRRLEFGPVTVLGREPENWKLDGKPNFKILCTTGLLKCVDASSKASKEGRRV